MCNLRFLRSEPFINNKTLYIYTIHGSLLECCHRIINLSAFQKDNVMVSIEGEEMKPSENIAISSFEELLSFNEKASISTCSFEGQYNDNPIGIVVDYWGKRLQIYSSKSECIESMAKEIES